jgi:hypothetical protein
LRVGGMAECDEAGGGNQQSGERRSLQGSLLWVG